MLKKNVDTICCVPEAGDTKVFWGKVGRVVGAEDRSCTPGMGTPGCQVWYLAWALSWALVHSSAPSPGEEWVTNPHTNNFTRGGGVHNRLYSHTDKVLHVLLLSRLSQLKRLLGSFWALHMSTCNDEIIDGGSEGATSFVALSLGHWNVQKWLYSSYKKEDQRKKNTKNYHTQKIIQQ